MNAYMNSLWEDWRGAPVRLTQEALLVGGAPVVLTSEEDLQQKLIENAVTSPGLIVMEIGYGLGFASRAIQKQSPKVHQIIESNAILAQRAAEEFPSAFIVAQFWEELEKKEFRSLDILIFEPGGLNASTQSDKKSALAHLEPIWSGIAPYMKSGAVIGALDPSGACEPELLQKKLKERCVVKIFPYIEKISKSGIGWFSDGCNIIIITIK